MGDIINQTIEFVKVYFSCEASGHDAYHTLRVYQMACRLAQHESCDAFVVKMAALLHDVDDRKIVKDTPEPFYYAKKHMRKMGLDDDRVSTICHVISQVSFKGNQTQTPDTIEGMIVQDADRLDAIGAIGIARTFAYGGNKGHKMYDPYVRVMDNMDEKTYYSHQGTTINHFYEKLFLLKDMMNTTYAKELAQHRHDYMKQFMEEFYMECDGTR